VADALFAWVNDHEGELSLVGAHHPEIGHVPLIFANQRIATSPSVRALAQRHADKWNRPVRLIQCVSTHTMETLEPTANVISGPGSTGERF
jgi:hypothetical protein